MMTGLGCCTGRLLCCRQKLRFADAQHVIRMKTNHADIVFTASRFKATKGDAVENFTIPLEGPHSLSFRAVAIELQAQMCPAFLLTHPQNPQDVASPAKRISGVDRPFCVGQPFSSSEI